MLRLLRVIAWLLIGLAGIAAITALLARVMDGPIGPFPGGPLASGELVTGPDPDWSFAAGIPTIELQVNPAHPLSRTVWVLVDQGELFVPAALAGRKSWPSQAVADGRVVIRVAGKRYERQATRVTDPVRIDALRSALGRKYGTTPGPDASDDLWFFRLAPRPTI
jgi:hypothetical protein